ncbi:hypothetical protein HaLaN_28564 [Haematococcus lacustris]|uniref:Uncharacterized protein n=1 Tax=Haematococcus lacustris TaxID=44745 RepID=A0A6A0AB22_HAELA|nr:hypothetical protein HaLaN_28564 [Haematococcus lacustris]
MVMQVVTYFGAELIKGLGEHANVPIEVFMQVAQLGLNQRGASDKGTLSAYQQLRDIMTQRQLGPEYIQQVKQKTLM